MDEISKFSSHTRNVDFAGRIICEDDGIERFNFGKYKGKSVEEVLSKDPAYYAWMMNNEFPLYTKKVLTSIKLRSAFNKT
jgi:DNA polymerase-3 subunit epsilon